MKQLLLCAGTILVVSLLRGVSTDFSYSSQAVYPAVTGKFCVNLIQLIAYV